MSSRSEPTAFVLQAAHAVSPSDCRLLLTRSVVSVDTGKLRSQTTAFELLEVSIDCTRRNDVDGSEAEPLRVQWKSEGGDLPCWCSWNADGWIVLCAKEFSPIQEEETAITSGVPAENGLKSEQTEAEPMDNGTAKEWPFSWTQNAESIAVTIPLPRGTRRSDVNMAISNDIFSLSTSTSVPPTLTAFLQSPSHSFWAELDTAESSLTYDEKKAIIELDLVKIEPNVRWPSLFFSEDDEEDVSETFSQSTLSAVSQTFDGIRTRLPDEPEGNSRAIPALLREEMDFELEDTDDFGEDPDSALGDTGGGRVGREVLVGFIRDGKQTWSKAPVPVLSTPLDAGSIVVKSAVDGLSFNPPTSNPSSTPWKHTATSPALAFVLSSKRHIRIVRHVADIGGNAILAFDSGSSSTVRGNLYVYYPPTSRTSARQGVVRISGVERGALLGVGCVDAGGKKVIVALCEKALVVLHGVV